MQLKEITFENARPVDGYGPGFFRVDGKVIKGAVLVTAVSAVAWSGPEDTAPLAALAGGIDVLLLGTGADMAPVPPGVQRVLAPLHIGIKPMASPAACRTYNVLLAEGRRIALAALPV